MGNFTATAIRFASVRQFSIFKIATQVHAHVSQDIVKLFGYILIGLFSFQLTGCGNSPSSSNSAAYSVGGAVSGLSGGNLILINNEIDALSVSSNGPYKFSLTSSGNGVYAVVLATQPPGQVCTVANGSGVITNANITNVNVACATSAEATLYAFSGGADGSYPDSGLTAGLDGNFYGTTTYGGANNLGTVYKITPAGAHTVLYSFTGGAGEGQYPASGLELRNDGAFYATTTAGGAFGLGTFIKITLDGIETMLYSFGENGSGAGPQGLTLSDDGNFYGTTTFGGANNLGTVYQITPAGIGTVLYSFTGGPDGQTPLAGLSNSSDGNLYGVTYRGGTDNFGTIFRIAPDGTGYATLHSFAGGAADGAYPGTKLRNVSVGSLYGSTGGGGANGLGTIFRYDPTSGVASVIHSFAGGPDDGSSPSCRLRVGNDGNLYGVTYYGGYFDLGTFFRITPAGMLTVLHSFAGGSDGQSPNSSLLVTSDGNFYGTTITGGPRAMGQFTRYTRDEMNLNRRIAMGKARISGRALILFGSLVFFASSALGQTCTPVVYAFRHAEDTNPPGEHPPVSLFALTPTGQAHAALYPAMVRDFQAANNFCAVAKVYATTKARKEGDCGNQCDSATNAFDTGKPLANAVMEDADPITTVGDGKFRLYEYLGNGNNAPTDPKYDKEEEVALRRELLATANAGESSAIFWTSQGLHVLGGAIINGTSKVPDKNGKPKVVPPRNAVYIFETEGEAPNIAKFQDIPANTSLYVQCFNFVGASIGVTPPGPRFIDPTGSPPEQTQLYYCGYAEESNLGGTLPEGCALNAQCGVIPNDQNKNIKGKICNTTTSMVPESAGGKTFGSCKFTE